MKLYASRRATFFVVLTIMCFASDSMAASPLTLVGGDDIVWAYRFLEADPGSPSQLQVVYALRTKPPSRLRFVPLQVVPIRATIKHEAVRGTNLHVFFGDGAHYRLRPPSRRDDSNRPSKNDFLERNLPDGKPPLTLCGDDKANVLYAIIRTRAANMLDTPPTTQPATQPATQPTSQPVGSTGEKTDADPQPVIESTRYTLVRYVEGDWQKVCPVPAFLDGHTFRLSAAYDGTYHLFSTNPVSPGELLHTICAESHWSEPAFVSGVTPGDVLGVFANSQTTVLVVRNALTAKNGFSLRTISLNDSQWRENETLTLDDADWTGQKGKVAVHRFQDDLAVAIIDTQDDAEVVRVGFWPIEGGQPTRKPFRIYGLTKGREPVVHERTRMLIATVSLTLILLFVFLRRRESFFTDLPTPPGYVLARTSRRFAAFVIDLVVIGLISYPAIFAPWLRAKNVPLTGDWQNELGDVMSRHSDEVYWLWMAAAGLYILYCIVFETVLAATPGKLLTRLRVAGSQGQPCSFKSIVLRNLLRFELYPLMQFLPIAILVALTRNRQRLGDLVARTVVVEMQNAKCRMQNAE